MLGWVRQRRHSADVHRRFVTETIEGLQTLSRRLWEVEEQLQEQRAMNRELERRTAHAEAERSVARRGFPDTVLQYAAAEEPAEGNGHGPAEALESEQAPELLGTLMPVLTSIRSMGPTAARQPDGGVAHLYFFPTFEGYELLTLPGDLPTVGSVIDLGEHGRGEVVKVARSPLVNDGGRCAYLLPVAAKQDEALPSDGVSKVVALVGDR
jgi:hypothetical protein